MLRVLQEASKCFWLVLDWKSYSYFEGYIINIIDCAKKVSGCTILQTTLTKRAKKIELLIYYLYLLRFANCEQFRVLQKLEMEKLLSNVKLHPSKYGKFLNIPIEKRLICFFFVGSSWPKVFFFGNTTSYNACD